MGKVLQFKPKALTEYQECRLFWDWCMLHPICRKYMFHIPNERASKNTRILLSRVGVKSGLSDYMLAYPTKHYHGLFLEMKRSNGKVYNVSAEQQNWIDSVNCIGYYGVICMGFNMARDTVLKYLSDP